MQMWEEEHSDEEKKMTKGTMERKRDTCKRKHTAQTAYQHVGEDSKGRYMPSSSESLH